MLTHAAARDGAHRDSVRWPLLGLAFFAYSSAIRHTVNGFIAAFVGGMAFGSVVRSDLESTVAFTEEAGGLLCLVVWLIFGAAMVVPGFMHATWPDYLFAPLALTVVRMVPVALSLLGSGLNRFTVGFVGWFGPRGLASVVFGLIAYDSLAPAEAAHVLSVVTVTITLSVLAHGLSASPLAARYGSFARTLVGGMPEMRLRHLCAPGAVWAVVPHTVLTRRRTVQLHVIIAFGPLNGRAQ